MRREKGPAGQIKEKCHMAIRVGAKGPVLAVVMSSKYRGERKHRGWMAGGQRGRVQSLRRALACSGLSCPFKRFACRIWWP
jgi:hypothetical protein